MKDLALLAGVVGVGAAAYFLFFRRAEQSSLCKLAETFADIPPEKCSAIEQLVDDASNAANRVMGGVARFGSRIVGGGGNHCPDGERPTREPPFRCEKIRTLQTCAGGTSMCWSVDHRSPE